MPKLSKEDVILKLMELGVEYDTEASYSDLLTQLKEAEKTNTLESGKNDEAQQKLEQPPKELPKVDIEGKEVKEEKNPFSSFHSKQPLTGKAHEMRKKLANQPKVPVYIPLGPDEKVGSTHQVTLNGYPMFIRKGQNVDVPVQVYEVLQEKFKHQMNVRQHPYLVSGGPQNIELQQFD